MLFLTSREREKGGSLPELPILIQEVSWIEGVGRLPLVLVKQHRSQIGNNCDSLVIKKKMTEPFTQRQHSNAWDANKMHV